MPNFTASRATLSTTLRHWCVIHDSWRSNHDFLKGFWHGSALNFQWRSHEVSSDSYWLCMWWYNDSYPIWRCWTRRSGRQHAFYTRLWVPEWYHIPRQLWGEVVRYSLQRMDGINEWTDWNVWRVRLKFFYRYEGYIWNFKLNVGKSGISPKSRGRFGVFP